MRAAAVYHRPAEPYQRQLPRLAAALLATGWAGLRDVVPAYQSLYVEYDPQQLNLRELQAWLAGYQAGRGEQVEQAPDAGGEVAEIPVCYDGEDLAEVAAASGLSVAEVTALHAGTTYTVRALGFVAGFPFMETTPPPLQLPRRASPRASVPPHSLAIANAQTGIYPVAAPGGWNLIGRTLEAVYDPGRERPFLVEPGQRVKFRPVEGDPPRLPPIEARLLWPAEPRHPVLEVIKAGALGLMMDEGRFRAGRYGLVRSGFLDTQSARLANELVGNAPGCAALELHLTGPQLEILSPAVMACAGAGMDAFLNGHFLLPNTSFVVQKGDRLVFRPNGQGRVTYLAVQGGYETVPFMGSASTDVKGGLGRPLQGGDVLGQALPTWDGFHIERSFTAHLVPHAPLRLLPVAEGEALSEDDLAALTAEPFTLRDLDRMAARLNGPQLRGGEITSEACPVGTIQVPPSGEPLILLNDKGTLGGYRKPARVHPDDLPRLVQTLPGQPITFIPG